jgi:hypothetical protein
MKGLFAMSGFALRIVALALASVVSVGSGIGSEERGVPVAKKNLYLGGDFDNWDWVPISYHALPEMKKARKAGIDLNCETRGPLYRVPVGLDTTGPCGYMVEGPQAYKGKSVRFIVNDSKNPFIMGQYLQPLHTDRRIGYEVVVKGKGKVALHVWLSGFNKTTNQFAWAGFPDIFAVEATDKWVRHAGSFTFPAPQNSSILVDKEVYARLFVLPGSDLMIDELKVWEEEP